jgi:RNA polymerase sigma-70 factor (ECF subfamily)
MELLDRAQSGDRDAFSALVEPHRGELRAHCYRMLGSLQDAEDALQETLLSAWLGLDGFDGRSSVRTWLYRIATNRCLNQLRSASRQPVTVPRSKRVPESGPHDRAPGPQGAPPVASPATSWHCVAGSGGTLLRISLGCAG